MNLGTALGQTSCDKEARLESAKRDCLSIPISPTGQQGFCVQIGKIASLDAHAVFGITIISYDS